MKRFLLLPLILIVLASSCFGQSGTTTRYTYIGAPLIFDGREITGQDNAITKEELIRCFEENKVTAGHTSAHVAGFVFSSTACVNGDMYGPYSFPTSFRISGNSATDTIPHHKKMANFVKKHLTYLRKNNRVFIEDVFVRTPDGTISKAASAFFIIR